MTGCIIHHWFSKLIKGEAKLVLMSVHVQPEAMSFLHLASIFYHDVNTVIWYPCFSSSFLDLGVFFLLCIRRTSLLKESGWSISHRSVAPVTHHPLPRDNIKFPKLLNDSYVTAKELFQPFFASLCSSFVKHTGRHRQVCMHIHIHYAEHFTRISYLPFHITLELGTIFTPL